MSKQFSPKAATNPSQSLIERRLNTMRSTRPFQLESSGILNGAIVLNDSAATSIDSTAESLLLMETPVIWIAQSNCNVQDIDVFTPLIKEKVKTIIAVGAETDEFLFKFWKGSRFFVSAQTWTEALELAVISAKANETILFSPGARAMEPFANFEERGAYFDKMISSFNHLKS